jgi:hypothetical protein
MRKVRISVGTAATLALLLAGGAAAQGTGHVVRGAVRDSSSGQLVNGAIVELAGPSTNATVRTDGQGAFQFAPVQNGRYRVTVRQIGFVEASRDVDVSDRDVTVSIRLRAASQTLDTVRVRAHVTAIYGVVGTTAGLRPVAGASVQIIGAQQQTTTDTAGRFFVPLKKGGSYFVRVRHDGFAQQSVLVDVANDQSLETFVLLDSGGVATGTDALWDEFDERLRWEGQRGALVPGDQITRWGGSTSDAIRGSQAFVRKGLQLGRQVCVFVNGVAKPGWPLDAIPPERIASVELYTSTGDETNTLFNRWPQTAACGSTGGVSSPTSRFDRQSLIQYAVIWLKDP